MIEQFKKAKINKEVLYFKNFQPTKITWDEVLKFIFDETKISNPNLKKKININNELDVLGNVQIQNKFWLAPQTNNLFSRFDGVTELLFKVNGNKEDHGCGYYSNVSCNCEVVWHTQGIRISLSDRHVPDHNDPWDILYWQLLGTSFWKINNDKVYELNPGDLLYFSQEDSHAVWCEGPRAGIIIDGIKLINK
jgi:hypothetical protein